MATIPQDITHMCVSLCSSWVTYVGPCGSHRQWAISKFILEEEQASHYAKISWFWGHNDNLLLVQNTKKVLNNKKTDFQWSTTSSLSHQPFEKSVGVCACFSLSAALPTHNNISFPQRWNTNVKDVWNLIYVTKQKYVNPMAPCKLNQNTDKLWLLKKKCSRLFCWFLLYSVLLCLFSGFKQCSTSKHTHTKEEW